MKSPIRGALLAATVATMFSTGGVAIADSHGGGEGETVKCKGINSCKGEGACGGATHDCAGKNECKGKGWIKVSEEECTEKGGEVVG